MKRPPIRRVATIALWAVAAVAATAGAAILYLQTGAGRQWLGRELQAALSAPGAPAKVGAITGFVPSDMRIARIELADGKGAWLAIDDAALAWSPASLLGGVLRIDRLAARQVEVMRQPVPSGAPSASTGFSLPRLPVAVDLRALAVTRLVLDPALAGGQTVAATLQAHGSLARRRAELALDLTRADAAPGRGSMTARYDEAAGLLDLDLKLDEPTGALLDALLGRDDHLPLHVALKGGGPLAGWKGELAAQAAGAAQLKAAIAFAHATGTSAALEGTAAIAALLPDSLKPAVGDAVGFRIAGAEDGKGGFRLDPSSLKLAAAALKAEGARADDGALSGNVHLDLADAAALEPLLQTPIRGDLAADAILSGTMDKPALKVAVKGQLAAAQLALDGLSLSAAATAGAPTQAGVRDVDLTLDLAAATLREAAEGGATYGPVRLHVAGRGGTDLAAIDIREATANGAGIDMKGSGKTGAGTAQGQATLAASDLTAVGAAIGRPLRGAATLQLTARTGADRTVAVQMSGGTDRLATGTEALDALLGGTVRIAGDGTRKPDGKIGIAALSVEGGRFALKGSGAFDPASRALGADLNATLADLEPLGPALSAPLAGSGTVGAKIGGTLDRPTIDGRAIVEKLAYGGTRIDRLEAALSLPKGLAAGGTATAQINSGKLDQAIEASFRQAGDKAYRIDRLHAAGTGGTLDAALDADLGRGRIAGSLTADLPDLSLWSGVVGQALAGAVAVTMDLPAQPGAEGPVKIAATRLSAGGASVGAATLSGNLSGDFGRPAGALDLSLKDVKAAGASIATGDARLTAHGNAGDFRARLAGRYRGPMNLDLAGGFTRTGAATELKLATMEANIRRSRYALARPLTVTIAPRDYRLAGLALAIDEGSITGEAPISATRASADLRIRQLPLRPLASLAGMRSVGGALDGSLTLGGSPRRSDAHLSLTTRNFDLQTDGPPPRPKLEMNATVDWRGERADTNVRLTAGTGEALTLAGSLPFAFDLASFTALRPQDPALALRLTGGGRVENLVGLMPLGEDRVSGGFTVDVTVGGTIDAPVPSGRIALTDGRYTNAGLGTEIHAIDLLVTGAGQRFVLDHLKATDGAAGRLDASGSVDLGVKPARVGVDLGFKDFLVARSDETTIDADGALKLAGDLRALDVSGTLGVRHGEIYLPERLPPTIVTLDVIEIGGKAADETAPSPPAAPVALRIALDAPGQLFVRGRGINSEWRGHVDVTGTSAAPVLVGQLQVVNGTAALLGQTFTLNRGVIGFNGGSRIDPTLDVQASAAAANVTAQVNVTGTANAPKLALSSVPALPQDEILSHVLFGENTGSLTASQGLQLAQAAATLAQGGPGMLDRVRSAIGLDRLDISGGGGKSTSGSGGQGIASGTTVSGGKYVANGVYVGVRQGTTTQSSQAEVSIEVTPNITVNSTFGASSGTGFGAKYTIDY